MRSSSSLLTVAILASHFEQSKPQGAISLFSIFSLGGKKLVVADRGHFGVISGPFWDLSGAVLQKISSKIELFATFRVKSTTFFNLYVIERAGKGV